MQGQGLGRESSEAVAGSGQGQLLLHNGTIQIPSGQGKAGWKGKSVYAQAKHDYFSGLLPYSAGQVFLSPSTPLVGASPFHKQFDMNTPHRRNIFLKKFLTGSHSKQRLRRVTFSRMMGNRFQPRFYQLA